MRKETTRPAIYSILPCPNGWSASGFLPEILNPTIVTMEAAASERLLNASAITATDFEKMPAISLPENSRKLKHIPAIPHRTP